MSEISLLSACTSGGCGAKIGPGELSHLLSGLPKREDPRLLVGWDGPDDAAVYSLDDETSLISTVDFFPPMVEDAETFGRIAAANALSDVYAMGGRPVTALNLVCFPQTLPLSILRDILRGGSEKVMEAGAVLAGGHSIYDKEIKYGLSVTGLVSTRRVLRNNTPQIGHRLILTKPLGVGILMAAARDSLASPAGIKAAVSSMERLNGYAASHMADFSVSACTDITGFGLLAHLLEVASDQVSISLSLPAIPYFPEAYRLAGESVSTGGGQRNRKHAGARCDVSGLALPLQELLFDPQTSGGLLICAAPQEAESLLSAIAKDDPAAAIIGTVIPKTENPIIFE